MPDYETDFYGWANEQAALLRAGRLNEADVANIAEEIVTLARGEKRLLAHHLEVLLRHLLKWRVQPGHHGTPWHLAVKEQRIRLREHLEQNHSLLGRLPDAVTAAFAHALLAVQIDTGLASSAFPPVCPWTPAEIMADDFHPQ